MDTRFTRGKSAILERSLTRPKTEVSLSTFALLFSEMVQYCQNRVYSVSELQAKLSELGQQVGVRILHLGAQGEQHPELCLLHRGHRGGHPHLQRLPCQGHRALAQRHHPHDQVRRGRDRQGQGAGRPLKAGGGWGSNSSPRGPRGLPIFIPT
ncbi:UNVERIFIED_CONTAM: hypothetical protein FKN15_059113 [Acipenser sinensis]